MRAKIDDVARVAGVSKTTVSRVLNKRGYLSEKTIKKVYDAMDDLNYHPNVLARQLFKQQTKLVGLIFPTVNNPFFGQLVSEMEKRLFNKGFKVLIGDSMNDAEKEQDYLQDLMAHQVDGLIVGAHNQGIREYEQTNLPIVAIDRIMNQDIPVISSDNYQGGTLATELLIEHGAQVIVHTNGPKSLKSPAQQRRQAYEDTMHKHGLEPITYTMAFNLSYEQKAQFIKTIFKAQPKLDGLFMSNDMDAAQAIEIAQQLGYQIPKDLKIVGYDGAETTRILLPNLTTIVQPVNEMAALAVDRLIARIENADAGQDEKLPVKLWRGRTV
ncbi:LacI family transcriptional regulator [Lactobacillus sp. CBA3605]|uniref:LacI family DNA-binding transcriptional regulator n=1 Tax=Lactobacillus sp. CBA3605 TaxID=2099788 RepID=UPI000CFDB35C|nr:LacI family DNA-binding transcriptional regulator [Lactobacillus sp. CBA3605]AVK62499.1 LacI family transcriptional regulator [Lactobacillus sp. CBA3605]